jgi:F-type H+-transporting ATPase subunit b
MDMASRLIAGLALGVALWAGATAAAVEDSSTAHGGPPAIRAEAPQAAMPGGQAASHPAQAGHGASSGALNPLDFKADLAIYTAVVFLVLLVVLWKLAWGPIVRGLEQRERRIHDEIASAEKANTEARELLAQYHARLAAAEGEVRGIVERGRREAEQLGREMLDRARAETEAEKQRALREIDLATAGALKELAERSATLAVELAGKILQSRLDPAAHAELIRRAVDRFPTNGGRQT